jgi:hypothetical protein
VQQCLQLLSTHREQCGQVLQQALALAIQAARGHAVALQQAGRRCFDHGVRQALADRDMYHAEQVGAPCLPSSLPGRSQCVPACSSVT